MANRYTREAKKQVGGVYDQQIQAAQSQIPAIQNLYKALTEGLQSQTQQQIQTGTRNIVEDASSRGVLRSTLPVDAQQELQSTLGQALTQGLAQFGAQEAQDIGGVRSRIGELRIGRAGAVTDLANQLRNSDLEDRRFRYQQKLDQQQLDLERRRLAIQSRNAGRGGAATAGERELAGLSIAAQELRPGDDGYVSPGNWDNVRNAYIRAGGSAEAFDSQFASYINPAHFARKDLQDYKVGSDIKQAFAKQFDNKLNYR